jgi:molybdenum cofactor cytidylyltransferase
MIYGLIPAAGHSRRMGRPKLALPLGGQPVLHHVISSLKKAGVSEILVVVGPHVSELSKIAVDAGAHCLALEHETADMRETVMHGLAWLENQFHPKPDDGWLLVPADHATLSGAIFQKLISEFSKTKEQSICLPVHEGKRGHPALLAWRHVQAINNLPDGVGLNHFIRNQTGQIREVEVTSPEVLQDMDTPQDYDKLLNEWIRL